MSRITPEETDRALELRRAGVAWPKVAAAVGHSERVVRAAVARRLKRGNLDEALEADRLDRLLAAVWPQAARGDLQAVDRALKIAEQRQRLLDPSPSGQGGRLAEAFAATVAAASVTDVDAALIEAGRTIAERVDRAAARGDGQELTKALYLMPHLMNMLRELGATPAARLEPPAPPAGQPQSPLDQLRERRARKGA